MDFAKAQYERIRKQLEGLTASQRMLTATLLVIMGITLVYWVKYAGKPEMEALLDQSMSAQDIARIRMKLDGLGIPYQVTGDRILVPADKKQGTLSALYYDQALPSNTTAAWDSIIAKINPWNSEHQNQQWWLQAKQASLAELMRTWPDVIDARVIIDATTRRGFTNAVKPSAMINIRTRDGKPGGKKLASAAADMVAGAHAGLERGQIKVAVNGAPVSVGDNGTPGSLSGADDLMDLRQNHEAYYSEKIQNQLRWLHAEVIATVAVDINTKATEEQSTTYDPKGTAKVETRTRTRGNEESTESKPSGEPGVGANTQGTLADAAPGGPSQTRNENEDETEFQAGLSKKDTMTREGPGRPTVLSASVRVPSSYFVRKYKSANPTAKDPDEATLAPLLERELGTIRQEVKNCLALTDDKAVVVEPYPDEPILTAAAEQTPTSGVGAVKDAVGLHGKEIALGVLAVVSLFMMMMMVRKGSPAPIVAHIPEPVGPVPQLAGGEVVVGEAGDGETVLGGMELDEAAAQTQQMLGQVSDLVKENPDAAANLIKRWMNK